MIELNFLKKIYKSKKGISTTAIDGINLKFGNSGMVFIVGKSGSGKSTLLNLLGGLDSVSSGEIIVNGKNISNFSSKEYDAYRNTYIGFVFQEFNILEEYNVYENIGLALKLQNQKPTESDIDKLLDKLGISGLGTRKVNELSGGQKQRVALARVLIKNPKIILADEPTGNLDKNSSKQIFEILKEISKEKLVIVVSHDNDSANTYADRIIEIEDGKVKNDSNDLKEVRNSDFKLKKSKLPSFFALKMSLSNFKFKPFKLIMTVILTTLSLIFMSIALNFYMFDKTLFITNNMKDNNNYVYDVYNTEYSYCDFGNICYIDLGLNDDDLKTLENTTGAKINPIYKLYDNNKELNFEFGYNDIDSEFYNDINSIYFVDVNDTRLFNNIIGNIPVNSNEIVVHKYFADFVIKFGIKLTDNTLYFPKNYNDLVSSKKEIKLGDNKVIIVGIIDDDDSLYKNGKDTGHFESQKLEQYFEENYSEMGNYIYGIDLIDNIKLNADPLSNLEYTTLTKISGIFENIVSTQNFKTLDNSINVISENGISSIQSINKNEVVISLNTLKNIYNNSLNTFDNDLLEYIKNNNLTYNEALIKFISNYLKENSNNIKLILNNINNNKTNVTVKGVSLDDNNYVSYEYISENEIRTKEIKSAKIYDDDINNLKNTFNKLKFKDDLTLDETGIFYTYMVDHSYDIRSIIYIYKNLSKYILIVSLVFVLFNFLLFSNFIGITISYSKKQIGILRALGASGDDVIKIFGFESIIIGIVSWIFSILGFNLICKLLNNSIFGSMYYTLNGIVENPLTPIIMIIYIILISFLITFISIKKITKIKPIDAILNK